MMDAVTHQDSELAEIDLTEDEIDAMMAAGEPVEVGPPPGQWRPLQFEVYRKGPRSGYGWRAISDEGQVLATSHLYATKTQAIQAARELMRAAPHAALVDHVAEAS